MMTRKLLAVHSTKNAEPAPLLERGALSQASMNRKSYEDAPQQKPPDRSCSKSVLRRELLENQNPRRMIARRPEPLCGHARLGFSKWGHRSADGLNRLKYRSEREAIQKY